MIKLFSIEAEQAVLGSILLDNDLIVDIRLKLTSECFYHQGHRIIFDEICKFDDNKKPVDFVTLCDCENIDTDILAEIVHNTFNSRNAAQYTDIMLDRYKRRRLAQSASEIHEIIKEYEDPDVALEKSIELIDKIGSRDESTLSDGETVAKELIKIMEDRFNGKTGLLSGFEKIDQRINGFRGGDLVVIAGSTGMGKTTYGLNLISNIAIDLKKPALVFSIEMPSFQILEKLISARGSVNIDDIRSSRAIQDESISSSFSSALHLIKESNIYIDDRGGVTPSYIRASSLLVKRKHGLGAILIDYIQLMEGNGENRTQQIGSISRALKALAKELDVPVFALSQINRGVASREDKRPRKSDLRESGAIEQDADIIQLLYRDEYYNKESEHKGLAEVITDKFRMGETGTDYLAFEGRKSRFKNLDFTPQPIEEKPHKPTGFSL